MGKVAILFAGQGAQHEGMCAELAQANEAARAVFARCDEVRHETSEQCWHASKETLSLTANTQPCVWAADMACARALEAAGVHADAVAGFSLGELAALAFAGALDEQEAFRLVCRRSELMDEACQANPGGMAAVLKLTPERIEELAGEAGAYAVNYNSPAQTVCAGSKEAIAALCDLAKQAGGRAMPLAVQGAFHSPLMTSAREGLEKVLAGVEFKATDTPVWANATATPYPADTAEARELLAAQVASPVRWAQTLMGLAEEGFDTFIEVGPGKTLTGLVKRTLPQARALSCETPDEVAAVVAALKED